MLFNKLCSSVLAIVFLLFAADVSHAAKPRRSAKPARTTKKTVRPAKVEAPQCKAMLLMDAASGEVLFEQNARVSLPPASMVKMMTAYVTMKHVEEGTIKMSDIITASAFASRIGGSQVYLREGEQFTLEQLLEAVMVHSSNDAATAIAEHIGGSAPGFVDLMNIEAEDLGMTECRFYSPHGLPPARDQQADTCSAYDLAILARAIVTKHPQLLEFAKKDQVPFRNGTFVMTNTNKLIRTFPGLDGLKTGFYNGAGFCVTATAVRNSIRMISVVMGCNNSKKRFDEAARLLTTGFAEYKLVRLIEKSKPIEGKVQIAGGIKAEIVPIAAETVMTSMRIRDSRNVTQKVELLASLQAPVLAGTKCGMLRFMLGDKEIGQVDLITPEFVDKLSLGGKVKRFLKLD